MNLVHSLKGKNTSVDVEELSGDIYLQFSHHTMKESMNINLVIDDDLLDRIAFKCNAMLQDRLREKETVEV